MTALPHPAKVSHAVPIASAAHLRMSIGHPLLNPIVYFA
jgi:hypothetical protein